MSFVPGSTATRRRHLCGFIDLGVAGEHGPGREYYFPTAPERIDIATGANFLSYSILALGEVQIPRGRRLRRVRWEGWIPGPGLCFTRDSYPPEFVWAGPSVLDATRIKELVDLFLTVQSEGEKRRLALYVTDTVIDGWAVYLGDFSYRYDDPHGSIRYTVEWVEARALATKETGVPKLVEPVDPDKGWVGLPPAEQSPGGTPVTDQPGAPPPPPIPGKPKTPEAPGMPGGRARTQTRTITGPELRAVITTEPVAEPRLIESPTMREVGGLKYQPAPGMPGIYRARGGETWLDVSWAVYHDTNAAEPIRQANPLYRMLQVLPFGAVVVMPEAGERALPAGVFRPYGRTITPPASALRFSDLAPGAPLTLVPSVYVEVTGNPDSAGERPVEVTVGGSLIVGAGSVFPGRMDRFGNVGITVLGNVLWRLRAPQLLVGPTRARGVPALEGPRVGLVL